ncbi:TetR/AcrR family transcriptional regulator [Luminiphilus sp.]|nr:TetR/AcrR family transcriptional regulator [Luminiphilus sp.]
MSPKVRRDQILDVAKQYIRRQGLQQFSLKQLAVEASVSEPLLFHYFTSRTELLQQLLKREFTRSLESLHTSLDNAVTLDDIVRIYVAVNYDQAFEGSVINILLAEPEIALAIEEIRSEKPANWTKNVDRYDLWRAGCQSKKSGYDRHNGIVCIDLCCEVFPREWRAPSRRHSNCNRLRASGL